MNILILGGTRFIGPYHVRAAIARGHRVAVFNRGQSAADLPQEVERLVGDRDNDLSSIRNRDWDAVIDLCAYGPGWVRSLGEALQGRVKHYTFISTNAVYENPSANDITTEDSPLLSFQGNADPYSLTAPTSLHEYGALKVLCEREAEKQFPGKTLVVRPGWIFGPGNFNAPFIYWPARMERGGEMLATGDPSTPIQYIDVRDVAEWVIRLVERRQTGTFNALGPAQPTRLDQLVHAAQSVVRSAPKVTWVPSARLAAQEDRAVWSNLLFWSNEPDGYVGMMRMSIERALKAGLTTRSPSVSLADTFAWYRELPAERQAALLSIPWPAYLEREKQLLR